MAGMQNGNSGRSSRHSRFRPMAEINVTPFVDVMLVLLVVFMVTAPLLSTGVSVDLPEAAAKNLEADDKPLTVSVDNEGRIFLLETELQLDQLAPRLRAIAENREDQLRIYVRGDKDVNYGAVMQVMGTLHAAGFARVALVTSPPVKTGQ